MPPDRRSLRIVYVSYDGVQDPLGQSQVLPYLEGLADRGHQFELISFEKPPHRLPLRERLHPHIRWTGLRYHKSPTIPATALDMTQGGLATALVGLLARADLVHARSYVAAALSLPFVSAFRRPLLFDMRGLWADERVEDGSWGPQSRVFAGAKKTEALLLRKAAGISVLTNSMAAYLREEYPERSRIHAPIHVIPTCADLERFHPQVRPDPEIARETEGAHTLVYLGALGGRYRQEEMARFYLAWRRAAGPSRFLVVSRQSPEVFRSVLSEAGAEEEILHRPMPRERVPAAIRCGQAGLFMYNGELAIRGVAPTKLGELLACGLPVSGNSVGDVPVLLDGRVGERVDDFSAEGLESAAARLFALSKAPDIATTCRAEAERWFSLERGLAAYDDLYHALARRDRASDQGWPRPGLS